MGEGSLNQGGSNEPKKFGLSALVAGGAEPARDAGRPLLEVRDLNVVFPTKEGGAKHIVHI